MATIGRNARSSRTSPAPGGETFVGAGGRGHETLRGAGPRWLVVLGAAVLLEQLLSGWKWRQILLDFKPVASLRLCGAILAGYAAPILLPLGISPLVRSWPVARREGLPMASVPASAAKSVSSTAWSSRCWSGWSR
jgi:hypothetical protein